MLFEIRKPGDHRSGFRKTTFVMHAILAFSLNEGCGLPFHIRCHVFTRGPQMEHKVLRFTNVHIPPLM